MLNTVHGPLIAIILTVLCSGICGFRINREDVVAVTDKLYGNSNLDLESLELVENDEAQDDIDARLRTLEDEQNENEEVQKDTVFGEADNTGKQRVTHQEAHQFTALYPQLASGLQNNPDQPLPDTNSSGQIQLTGTGRPYNPDEIISDTDSSGQIQLTGTGRPYNPDEIISDIDSLGQIQLTGTGHPYNPDEIISDTDSSDQNVQLASGLPYNPYRPLSKNNYSGQNLYQQQPGYNPYTQNPS